jgi:hypothetical protein
LGYFSLVIPKFSINAVVFGIVFAFFIPVSALIADRIGRRKMLMPQRPSLFLVLPFLFLNSGSPVLVTLFLCIGMFDDGLLVLWELSCRNCFLRTFVIGTSLAFNMAGIIRAALRL